MKNLLYIALVLTMCSCVTYQKCKEKYGNDSLVLYKDSTFVKHDTIYVKSDTMGGEVSLKDLLSNDYIKDSARQTIVIKYKDGKIKYVNICKADTLYKFDTIRISHTKYVTNNFKDQSFLSKFKWWWLVLLAVVIACVGYFIQAVKK